MYTLQDANKALPGNARPYAHEIIQGHWDFPKETLGHKIHIETCKKLFLDVPNWALIVIWNQNHYHNGKLTGCWWIMEANPAKIPRKYFRVFPLIVSKMKDGTYWIDRKNGALVNPDGFYDVILKTLTHKDIFSKVHETPTSGIRDINRSEDKVKEESARKILTLDEQFAKETVNDEKSKIFVP